LDVVVCAAYPLVSQCVERFSTSVSFLSAADFW
jgi:hypothetical protein